MRRGRTATSAPKSKAEELCLGFDGNSSGEAEGVRSASPCGVFGGGLPWKAEARGGLEEGVGLWETGCRGETGVDVEGESGG